MVVDPTKLKMFIARDLPGYELAEGDHSAEFASDASGDTATVTPASSTLSAWQDKALFESSASNSTQSSSENPYLTKFRSNKPSGDSKK